MAGKHQLIQDNMSITLRIIYKIPIKVLKGQEAVNFWEDMDFQNVFHSKVNNNYGEIIDGIIPMEVLSEINEVEVEI